jgi:Flp pilus assembly protein TadG
MIESALIFSLLLTIIVGVLNFGQQLLAYHFVAYAAREATRYASVRGRLSASPATPDSIEKFVKQIAMGVDPASIHVKTVWTPDNEPGAVVKIEVRAGEMVAASQVSVLH